MNSPPTGGSCTANPTLGHGYNTEFEIECIQWGDRRDDLPLRYSFYRKTATGNVIIKEGKSTGDVTTEIPIVPTDSTQIAEVEVQIEDKWGATTYEIVQITINPAVRRRLLATGDVDTYFPSLQSYASAALGLGEADNALGFAVDMGQLAASDDTGTDFSYVYEEALNITEEVIAVVLPVNLAQSLNVMLLEPGIVQVSILDHATALLAQSAGIALSGPLPTMVEAETIVGAFADAVTTIFEDLDNVILDTGEQPLADYESAQRAIATSLLDTLHSLSDGLVGAQMTNLGEQYSWETRHLALQIVRGYADEIGVFFISVGKNSALVSVPSDVPTEYVGVPVNVKSFYMIYNPFQLETYSDNSATGVFEMVVPFSLLESTTPATVTFPKILEECQTPCFSS